MNESGFYNLLSSQIPTEWNKFTGLRLLHRSQKGFAEVYIAKKNGRLHIIKTLREKYRRDPVAISALRKEYDLGFRVESDFVSRTLDLVPVEDLGTCIIIDYCPGTTLSDILSSDTLLSDHEIISIIEKIAAGITDIHSAGIIHRDIKPSNILYDPQTGNVKIIDFGCADSSDFTILKCDAGTAGYMPETGGSSPLADLFALGVTCKEIAEKCESKSLKRRILKASEKWMKGQNGLPMLRHSNKMGLVAGTATLLIIGLGFIFLTRPVNDSNQSQPSRDSTANDSLLQIPAPINAENISNISSDAVYSNTQIAGIETNRKENSASNKSEEKNDISHQQDMGAENIDSSEEKVEADKRDKSMLNAYFNLRKTPFDVKVIEATDSICTILWNRLEHHNFARASKFTAEDCDRMLDMLASPDMLWEDIKATRADIAQGDTAHAHSIVRMHHYSKYDGLSSSIRDELERGGKIPRKE